MHYFEHWLNIYNVLVIIDELFTCNVHMNRQFLLSLVYFKKIPSCLVFQKQSLCCYKKFTGWNTWFIKLEACVLLHKQMIVRKASKRMAE